MGSASTLSPAHCCTKIEMSGLSKVEMSSFACRAKEGMSIERGPDWDEPAGAGRLESNERGVAGGADAEGGGAAVGAERASGAAGPASLGGRRGRGGDSSASGPALEPADR